MFSAECAEWTTKISTYIFDVDELVGAILKTDDILAYYTRTVLHIYMYEVVKDDVGADDAVENFYDEML